MSKKQKINLLINTLLWLAFFIVFQNKDYSYDSIEYATNVRNGTNIFHPHHLLYNACGYLLYNIFGGKIDPLRLLSGANAFLIAIVFVIIVKILYSKTDNFLRSIWIANLFAVSSGALYIASSVEVYASAIFFQSLALLILIQKKNSASDTWFYIFLTALVSSLGALFHQTAVFFIPVAAWFIWRENKKNVPALAYLLMCAILILVPYYFCASHYGYSGIGKTIDWALYYMRLPEYGGGALGKLGLDSFVRAIGGISQTIFSFSIDLTYYQKASLLFPVGVVFALFFSVSSIYAIICRFKREKLKIEYFSNMDSFRLAILLLALINSIFAFWWEPNNFEFWLLAAPFWVLFFGLEHFDKSELTNKSSLLSKIINEYPKLKVAVISLFIANFSLKIYLSSKIENNDIYQISHQLARYLPDEKTVVIGNIIELSQYLNYFESKEIELKSLSRINYLFDSEKDKAKAEYRNILMQTLESRDLILLENELYPSFDKLSYYKNWNKEDYVNFYMEFVKMAIPLDYYEMNGKKCRIFLIPRKNYG